MTEAQSDHSDVKEAQNAPKLSVRDLITGLSKSEPSWGKSRCLTRLLRAQEDQTRTQSELLTENWQIQFHSESEEIAKNLVKGDLKRSLMAPENTTAHQFPPKAPLDAIWKVFGGSEGI